VPFTITHVAVAGDTYADLAKRFCGSPRYTAVIATYNSAVSPRPPPGTAVEIPIGHVRIDPLRLEELTNERVLGIALPGPDERRVALRDANALARGGRYWALPLRLAQVLARDIPDDKDCAEVFRLLAIVYVALDKGELAAEAFQEALARQPALSLDPVANSPRVLSAFEDAKARRKAR
jgi:hypothetical protein